MNIAIYVWDGYSETDLCIPTLLFKEENVMTLSSNQDIVRCNNGFRIVVDKKVKDVEPMDIDMLIIPGGNAVIEEDILELIRVCEKNKAIIAGICGGVDYLAHAGILSDRKFTGYYQKDEQYDHLPTDGILTYNTYESDRNVVTAQPKSYLEFAVELMNLAGYDLEDVDFYVEWFKSPFTWSKK